MADSKNDGIKPVTANEFVEQELHRGLEAIETVFSCHALSINGPLFPGVDDILRSVIEKKCVRSSTSSKLVILLTTPGGMLEPVQRMVATIRRHYQIVDFLIPNYAYSAGTIFALSGDSILIEEGDPPALPGWQ
jgi:membrane-bound ClpP family serine protease